MQSALRLATRRAVGVRSRRGVATTTPTTKATATAACEDWLAEHEKAWVKAMVQREVRAQMLAEEERRIARDRLRAAAEERSAATRRLAYELELWGGYCACSAVVGAGLAMLLFGR